MNRLHFNSYCLKRRLLPLILALGACMPSLSFAADAPPDDVASVKAIFAHPPRQYSSGPLWVWNDMLTEEQIRGTLQDLATQKVKQAWVHPRPGLMTPYLGEDWFRLWKVALDEAERLDMNIWIYDENSYPSGFAGGLVPEAMPESRGMGLHFSDAKAVGQLGHDVVVVYRKTADGYENVTRQALSGQAQSDQALPEGKPDQYLIGRRRMAPSSGWFGGKYYVDLLMPGVTEKFLEITMGAYQRELGEHFGQRVPGVFTDEPHLSPAGGIHWSNHLPELFQQRWGYDLADHLPSLVRPVGDWRRVRHNYYQLCLEQFIERFAKPCYEYCEKHNLEFTGHYWEHGWPGAGHGGDNMAMYAWHQRPAIDNLMNDYSEGVHGQFGNARTVKELSSVANQLGRRRTLCETYGAGGWDLRFEDMKRIGDWLYVLGVNTLNEHLSYITIRGARKRDHPQSFSYHTPWWEAYHVMAGYFTRLSLALSSGEQVNHVLLIQPTTSTWMYQPDPSGRGRLNAIGNSFQDMINQLERVQAEYDVGCEDIMARHGSVEGKLLKVGPCQYDTLVLPPLTENLNGKTMDRIEAYAKAGGRVLCCGEPPTRVDGQLSDRPKEAAENPGWRQVDMDEAIAAMQKRTEEDGLAIRRSKDDRGILFHHRRRLDDGDLLFLVNTSIDDPSTGVIESAARGIEQWDLHDGVCTPYGFSAGPTGVRAEYNLPPCGSLLLFLSNRPCEPASAKSAKVATIRPLAPPTIGRVEPNVLTLDYVDVSAGGETIKNVYVYHANQFAFRQNGMERNPWDSAVQLRDQLITRKFPANSGLEATYRFTIEGHVPDPLEIVIERPDLYTITCNGTPVTAGKGRWWLDKAFGRIDITSAAKVGTNEVTIKASPFTIYHELESAYVLGDFWLKPTDSGFVIMPPRSLGLGRRDAHVTTPDGTMWLSAGIGHGGTGGAKDDGDPLLVFDLGKVCDLAAIKIWNYNEVNLTTRGVNELQISGSATGKPGTFTIPIGTFKLDQAVSGSTGPTSDPYFPRMLRVRGRGRGVRFVEFDVLSNHRGVTFPTRDGSVDNAFVGLSEVQFFAESGQGKMARIDDVTIAKASSELTGQFNRRAKYLVDGSGQGVSGWNRQGHPFYAAGVAYTEQFKLPRPTGRYYVHLPAWYGSVAKVAVNGQPAGYITHPPWQCEVTEWLRPGANTIEVTVIGTLKNTLGPHHIGPTAGRAWPNMFHSGPEPGPPPGEEYDTLDYGLFAPFVLKHAEQ